MRDQDSDQLVDLTMRELLEEHELVPDEPRSNPSLGRQLCAIDAEIEKLSDLLDDEEELRNRAALSTYLASYETEADFRDAAELFKSQASAACTEDPGPRTALYASLVILLRLRDSLGAP
jgi:hypothetical protein